MAAGEHHCNNNHIRRYLVRSINMKSSVRVLSMRYRTVREKSLNRIMYSDTIMLNSYTTNVPNTEIKYPIIIIIADRVRHRRWWLEKNVTIVRIKFSMNYACGWAAYTSHASGIQYNIHWTAITYCDATVKEAKNYANKHVMRSHPLHCERRARSGHTITVSYYTVSQGWLWRHER